MWVLHILFCIWVSSDKHSQGTLAAHTNTKSLSYMDTLLDSLRSLCNTEAMLCPAVTGFTPTRDRHPSYGSTGLIWILRVRQDSKGHTYSYKKLVHWSKDILKVEFAGLRGKFQLMCTLWMNIQHFWGKGFSNIQLSLHSKSKKKQLFSWLQGQFPHTKQCISSYVKGSVNVLHLMALLSSAFTFPVPLLVTVTFLLAFTQSLPQMYHNALIELFTHIVYSFSSSNITNRDFKKAPVTIISCSY